MAQLSLRSPAFEAQGSIPKKYTCDGENIAPALEWSGVPARAKSLALIVEDPDAPDPAAPKRIFVHWVLYDIPPSATRLAEGARADQLPAGTHEGRNDGGKTGYIGPCPPIGRHRYFFRLYALDSSLGDIGTPTKAELTHAMQGHVLGEGEVVGTYQREK